MKTCCIYYPTHARHSCPYINVYHVLINGVYINPCSQTEVKLPGPEHWKVSSIPFYLRPTTGTLARNAGGQRHQAASSVRSSSDVILHANVRSSQLYIGIYVYLRSIVLFYRSVDFNVFELRTVRSLRFINLNSLYQTFSITPYTFM